MVVAHRNHKFGVAVRHSSQFAMRPGMTLVELLVAVAILLLLIGIVFIASKIGGETRKLSSAQQQMAQVAAAINQYATFWPAWTVNGVQLSQKGWPDFIPARLFAGPPTGSYLTIPGLNDVGRLKFTGVGATAGVYNGITVHMPEDYDIVSPTVTGDPGDQVSVFNANLALAYQLTAVVGKGPYLRAGEQNVLVDVQNDKITSPLVLLGQSPISNPFYPSSGAGSSRAQVLVDAWGTPLRYFWVYRPKVLPANQVAYRGFLPVDFGPMTSGDLADNGPFDQDPTSGVFVPKSADGFVLESAGPDRKFGNVWKLVPDPLPANFEATDADIIAATDNIIIAP